MKQPWDRCIKNDSAGSLKTNVMVSQLINIMPEYYFLAPPQLRQLSVLPSAPARLELSLDLGRTRQEVEIERGMIVLSNSIKLPLPGPELLAVADARTILICRENAWQKWQRFDEPRNKFYKMIFVAEGAPPTVEINGIKMHVTKDGYPALDTRRKLSALGRVHGHVLDTCCGLAYTARALAAQPGVKRVLVCEVDRNMIGFCRENPWSRELWQNPGIVCHQADAAEFIRTLPDKSLGGILHDPPRFSLAPELYTESFYRECCRVLPAGGRIYHYTGNPHQQKGRSLPEQTIARLKKSGFRKALRCYQGALGIK